MLFFAENHGFPRAFERTSAKGFGAKQPRLGSEDGLEIDSHCDGNCFHRRSCRLRDQGRDVEGAAGADGKMKRVPALDGLRGLAILSVLIWHYSHFYEPPAGSFGAFALSFFKTTWSGVDLFFVLSGFLIGGILIDNRTAGNLWKVFYIRRTLRIFPLYFLGPVIN